ncbi:unnamed protein product, partial [marine sediment metagenome]
DAHDNIRAFNISSGCCQALITLENHANYAKIPK